MTVASTEPDMTVPPGPKVSLGTEALLGILVALLGLTIVLVLLSVPVGVYTVFIGRLSPTFDYNSLGHAYLWIGPIFEQIPYPVGLGIWFLVLTAVYVAFMAIAAKQGRNPVSAIVRSFSEGVSSLMSSPFLVVMIATGFLAFSASMIDLGVSSSGAPIGGPQGDPLSLLIGFTTAPLVEEFGFRVLLIGVVASILSMGRSWKDALAALWRPSRAIEGLAVGSGASIILWAATALSAGTFGACHVLCGNAWDIGKFPEAAFGGAVLGILYVKYGFHAAVLVHWGINYFGSIYAFFGQAAYGIPWDSSTREFVGQYIVDLDMILLFGIASFLLVLYLVIKKFTTNRVTQPGGGFDKGPRGGGNPLP